MTTRQFTEDTLVIATHNAGKMREIGALFASFDIHILSAADLGLAEPDETETSWFQFHQVQQDQDQQPIKYECQNWQIARQFRAFCQHYAWQ